MKTENRKAIHATPAKAAKLEMPAPKHKVEPTAHVKQATHASSQAPANLETTDQKPNDAPRRKDSRRVFQTFTDATRALLDSPDTPAQLHEALADAICEAGNILGAFDYASAGIGAQKTLDKIFSSNDEDDEEADKAADELAKAFATIEEYSGYIPEKYYKGIADGIHDWSMEAQWICDPQLMRIVLPRLLRKVIGNAEKEDA